MQPGVVTGAVLELHAARADRGMAQGNNEDPTGTWYDSSGSGNHGTLSAFAYTTASGWDASPYKLVFDGTSDLVELPDLSLAEDKTVSYEAWCRTSNSAANVYAILGEDNGVVSAWEAGLVIYLGNVYGRVVDAASASYVNSSTVSIADGLWHHVVMTWGGSNKLAVYHNGALLQGDISGPAGTPVITRARLGLMSSCGTWDGDVAVARIYPTALSAGEVAQNYAAGYEWYPMAQPPRRETDEALWQVTVGNATIGYRDITAEVGDLVYSNVRPGGAASCSFTVPADIASLGYNELQSDMRVVVRYGGRTVWDGYVLPRGIAYEGN